MEWAFKWIKWAWIGISGPSRHKQHLEGINLGLVDIQLGMRTIFVTRRAGGTSWALVEPTGR